MKKRKDFPDESDYRQYRADYWGGRIWAMILIPLAIALAWLIAIKG